MSSISIVSVSKKYGGVDAVKNLTVGCPEGEMLALLGPSGCGKSTTLKMLAGIEAVSSGEIYFGNRPVSNLAPGERNIAMVFEDYALYPQMTVWENIAFPLKVRNVSQHTSETRISEVVELLGLGSIVDQSVKGLSGGAQQRVAIGRALVRDPEVLLFDEPLSHLDADQKVLLRGEIKRLQKLREVTSILVTHDQIEATAIADRIAVMNYGVLQQVGTSQEIYERPVNLFVANFIGEPPMNIVEAVTGAGKVSGRGWACNVNASGNAGLDLSAGREIVVGIRPEHVEVHSSGENRTIAGVVRHREPQGDHDVLRVETEGPAIVAEIAGPSTWREGDHVSLRLREDRLHFFDKATGRNLLVAE